MLHHHFHNGQSNFLTGHCSIQYIYIINIVSLYIPCLPASPLSNFPDVIFVTVSISVPCHRGVVSTWSSFLFSFLATSFLMITYCWYSVGFCTLFIYELLKYMTFRICVYIKTWLPATNIISWNKYLCVHWQINPNRCPLFEACWIIVV